MYILVSCLGILSSRYKAVYGLGGSGLQRLIKGRRVHDVGVEGFGFWVWVLAHMVAVGLPQGSKGPNNHALGLRDSSFVGWYSEEYMIIRYLDP